jgi:DNA-binding HxlR family transcriptional regulator
VPGVTPRALALALKDLEAAGLVERLVDDQSYPPTVTYAATRAAAPLQRALA